MHKSFMTSPPMISPAVAGTHALEAGVNRFWWAMVSSFSLFVFGLFWLTLMLVSGSSGL